ncbi:sodium:proton antiporter [Neorhodopirellula lusitana]|uniref:sodium:proton antiporter n=1 Tax=Neorhodopirellula lusitana TaxID=445327 RepID=UPI00384B7C37
MMTGFYIVLARKNLIKSVIGLNVFQTSVFLLYITMGKVRGGTAPIIPPDVAAAAAAAHGDAGHADAATHSVEAAAQHTDQVASAAEHAASGAEHVAGQLAAGTEHAVESIVYSNPLPSVLMLTAIVVGIATTALALALVVRIREDYGTIDEEQILKLDRGE